MTRSIGRFTAAGVALAGFVGLGLLAAPAGAGAAPELPPVSAEELAASVLTAEPGAFAGTVELDNALGLPAVPALPQLADGTHAARVWSDGDGRGRLQVPSGSDERTLVADGTAVWLYDAADRTATRVEKGARPAPEAVAADPAAAAAQALELLRASSVVSVDGTAEVAGRPAYELVLAPTPSERTLLREVRIAVDAERRLPLRLTVLTTGSPDPAVQIGFTELSFADQDPALFTFTPPPGTTVQEREPGDHAERPELPAGVAPTVVGDGWDTVVVATLPADAPDDRAGALAGVAALGRPVSGPWGSGFLVGSAVANVIVTDDGRIAAGAVPEQVLAEALAR